MFKNFTFLMIFLLGLVSSIFAQGGHDHTRCGMQHHMEIKMQDPEFAAAHREKLARLEAYSAANNGQRMACPNPVVLPMAVHFQGISNPSQSCLIAMAERQIQILNEDYGGYNADITNWTNGTAANFPGVSNAETCVQFCLATRNHPVGYGLTEGQPAVTFNVTSGDFVSAFSGYINIFVRNDPSGQVLGYSPLGGSGNGDGVFIDDNSFSTAPACGTVSPQAPYNGGRTLTHELGHYLLLNHIWGDGGCGADDGVADTPIASSSYGGCPVGLQSSCGSLDMHMNYMDYTNDACMYMFTAGQATRMENYVASNLSNVASKFNTVCSAPPSASISASTTIGCAPLTVNFSDNSEAGPTSWSWAFQGGSIGSSSSQNPGAVTFNSPGTYNVTLTATNAQGSSTANTTIIVESCNGCVIDNHMEGTTGVLIATSSVSQGGTGYVSGHNNFNDIAKAEFFSFNGPYDKVTDVDFEFGQATGSGNLEFVIWDGATGQPGAELASVNVPVSTIAADVSAGNRTTVTFDTDISGDVFVGFKLVTNGPNTIAIKTSPNGTNNPTNAWEQWSNGTWYPFNDGTNSTWNLDVALAIFMKVCNPSVSTNEIEALSTMSINPNPVRETVNLELASSENIDVNIDIYDAMGRKVLSTGNLSINGVMNKSIDASSLSAGTYFVRMNSGKAIATQKFVKL